MDNSGFNSSKKQYLEKWTTCVQTTLEQNIQEIIEESKLWESNAHGLDIPGFDAEELLHHGGLARDKCSDFVERIELIDECFKAILQSNRGGVKFDGVSLAIVGVSGAGKTALMAKLAQLSYERDADIPVLIRFCGTSRGSRTGFDLVRSLCVQIILLYNLGKLRYAGIPTNEALQRLSFDAIPKTFKDLVGYFHFLLAHFICMIFIDSLDQLTDEDTARRNVPFLENVKPHGKTRIIVSMLPDDDET